MNFNKKPTSGIGLTSARARKRLVEELRQGGISNEQVLDVLYEVPRHEFLEDAINSHAYDNAALPIGFGQTISQPSTVAIMTATLLKKFPQGMKTVLEIGTGCGYQSAVISCFAEKVISIERIKELHYTARDRLYDLKYRNVKCIHADGFLGCKDFAPYDGILAAAVSEEVPNELIEQLSEGGRLVMPLLDTTTAEQNLIIVDKTPSGIHKKVTQKVTFVPRIDGVI